MKSSNLCVRCGALGSGLASGDMTFGWLMIINGSWVVSRYLPANLSSNLRYYYDIPLNRSRLLARYLVFFAQAVIKRYGFRVVKIYG